MWKFKNRQTLFTHPRITLLEDTVELPGGEVVPYLLFENKNDSATIICTKGEDILLQEEYSYPIGQALYQFPGGKLEGGEDPAIGARRELLEESGYVADDMELLGWYYPNNRRSASKMYVFLATDPAQGTKAGGDLEEDITSQWVSIDSLNAMIDDGKIVNFSVLAAWALFQKKR